MPPIGWLRRRGAAFAAILAFGALSVGCGTTASPPSSVTVTAAPSRPAVGSSGSALARADQSLLAFAPAGSAGLTLTYDPETTATEIADPTLDPNVAALATGIASAASASASAAGDLVIVNVVRLRDASVDETWFRGWRDSYDEAACEPAGGVSGHAEATINGHDVFIGTCRGGAYTYHLRVSGGAIIVSLTSIGLDRLGEKLVRAMPTS